MSKLIISHIADIDGLNSVVIAKLVYPSIEYKLVEFSDLYPFIRSIVESKEYLKYSEIFITDVSIRSELIEYIKSIPDLVNKIKHFDHHSGEIDNNKYPFINVVLSQNGKETCGTSLLYNYFLSNGLINQELYSCITKSFVEATRSRDNWLKESNLYNLGCELTEMAIMYGPNMYISEMINNIRENKPLVSENNKVLIQMKYQSIKEYIEKCDENLIFMDLDGHHIGISFSEQYRSEVGNALSKRYENIIDYILIINLYRMQYSFRTVKTNVDVSMIAKSFDKSGGGHPASAGVSINENTLWIAQKALNQTSENKLIKKL